MYRRIARTRHNVAELYGGDSNDETDPSIIHSRLDVGDDLEESRMTPDVDEIKEHHSQSFGLQTWVEKVRRITPVSCYSRITSCVNKLIERPNDSRSSRIYASSSRTLQPRRLRMLLRIICFSGVVIFLPITPIYYILWGRTTLHGGILGRLVDCTLRSLYFRQIWKQRNIKLQTWGIEHLVETLELPKRPIPILPQSTFIETTIRRKHRTDVLQALEVHATKIHQQNRNSRLSTNRIPRVIFQPTSFFRPIQIQQQQGVTEENSKKYHVILFDDLEMRRFISKKFDEKVLKVYDSFNDRTMAPNGQSSAMNNKIFLWVICVLYWYGGYFLGDHVFELPPRSIAHLTNENDTTDSISMLLNILSNESRAPRQKDKKKPKTATSMGMAVFDMTSIPTTPYQGSQNYSNTTSPTISIFAFPPRHDLLKCAIEQISQMYTTSNANNEGLLQVSSLFLTEDTWKKSNIFHQIQEYDHSTSKLQNEKEKDNDVWDVLHQPHANIKDKEVCQGKTLSSRTQGHDLQTKINELHEKQQNGVFVRLTEKEMAFSASNYQSIQKSDQVRNNVLWDVQIQQKNILPEGTPNSVKSPKFSIQAELESRKIYPTWLCMRCLKTPYFGSHHACLKAFVCPKSYASFMFHQSRQENKLVDRQIDILINMNQVTAMHEKMIPRIIHQTWFEELLPERYSDLVRLQNTWRSSGWDYRFYTDESARSYIVQNYPPPFVEAFDVLIPGAFKADFFRYLLLLKDGGVYADIDVVLDTNLETFITPTMSFFVPRDLVVEYADENFCLWNGLIGSAPGHPFMVRAVERLVNLIVQRADLFDIERDLCRRHRRHYRSHPNANSVGDDTKLQVWKSRAVPELTLSGPCALGISINEVLGKDDTVAKFYPGWLPQPTNVNGLFSREGVKSLPYFGDALILMADKTDHGMFGFTDIDRNILVASTDLPGINKKPQTVEGSRTTPTKSDHGKTKKQQEEVEHYHDTTGDNVWGSKGVYRDNWVTNERIVMKQIYKNADQ